jgi:hypothetical protein
MLFGSILARLAVKLVDDEEPEEPDAEAELLLLLLLWFLETTIPTGIAMARAKSTSPTTIQSRFLFFQKGIP